MNRPALCALFVLMSLGACQTLPSVQSLTLPITDPAARAHRSTIEIEVKSNFTNVLRDVGRAGGPDLWRAMEVAGVPESDRAPRALQLQGDYGLYAANPNALVNALFTFAQH